MTDNLSAKQRAEIRGAENGAKRVQEYWHSRGFSHVKAWVERKQQMLGGAATSVWVVESNLIGGQPPSIEQAHWKRPPAPNIELPPAAVEHLSLTVIERNILNALWGAAEGGLVQISVMALADMTELHSTTVKSAMSTLESRGFIKVDDRGASRRAATYKLLRRVA